MAETDGGGGDDHDRMENKQEADVQNAAMKIERGREAYKGYVGLEEKPSKVEIWCWYLYGLSSYFVLTTLVPVVFPLIISQISSSPQHPVLGWNIASISLVCTSQQMQLYESVTQRSISVNHLKFSPLEWTSISWLLALILSSPLIHFISTHLDYTHNQKLIAAASTAVGSLSFLPVGFFHTACIFPLYITLIVASYVVASASHTRHLALMVRGFTGPSLYKSQFPVRSSVSGWFSSFSTVFGCLGSAVLSAFTYHMLQRYSERFVSLWVVSIFSGLKWLLGMFHVMFVRPGASVPISDPMDYKPHFLTLFKYPHAVGTLFVIFLSSFTTMCIFTGGILYLVGQQCLKSIFILYFWLTYFIFPSFSLPLLQPLQQVIRADSIKMQLVGFFLALLTSSVGYHFRGKIWERQHILVFSGIQSTCTGLLHAFGRVLLLDCTPNGKEGAFSMWFSWVKALGTCAGFAVASAMPGNISASFRIAFCTAMIGIITLIFGNISDVVGAKAAGVVHEESSEKGSPVPGLDTSSIIIKQPLHDQTT
ncbi:hypothetical protein Ddye_001191 [Dipteronia dyeriana]|uniref:Uncharacterized protein n=1 Tax=Dipteronia dyeriana TaxID=168575 RepID=A0AAD9XNH9_9ROSI|nr:hypothetical protein Ddye_001191 [Dipteronia dyeriana]